jgi:regulator of replication initiation timing
MTDEELRIRYKKVVEENKMLLMENENLLKVVDSMRRRGVNKFGHNF